MSTRLFPINEPRVYTFHLQRDFCTHATSYLVEFFSSSNMVIPFPAVMVNHRGPQSYSTVHSFNRVLNDVFEDDEINTIQNTWAGTLIRTEVTIRITKSGKEGTVASELRFTPMHDVFSAMLQVRSHKLATGDKLVLPILPFDKPYLLRVQVLGREKFAGRDPIKLSVALQKIDPATKTLLPYAKMKSTTLWLADDANRIPVELRSEVFIGDVRMTLSGARKL